MIRETPIMAAGPRGEETDARGPLRCARTVLAVVAAALILALAFSSQAVAAPEAHWQLVQTNSIQNGLNQYIWEWVDESGDVPETITYNGREIDNGDPLYCFSIGTTAKPMSWVPDGYEEGAGDETPLDPTSPNPDQMDDISGDRQDLAGELISETDPSFSLSFEFLGNAAIKLMWMLSSGAITALSGMAEWFLALAGMSGAQLFTADYATGDLAGFYEAAQIVSAYAIRPYAYAAIGVVFMIWLVRSADSRKRQTGFDWFTELLTVITIMVAAITFIRHAVDMCGAIYWAGSNLLRGVEQALVSIGLSPGISSPGLTATFTEQMNAITYDQWGFCIAILLLSLIALVACCAACFVVLGAIFTRFGKIYIMATVSPLALAALLDNGTRHYAFGFIRSFLALIFQAVLIFLALAFAPLVFDLATGMVGSLVSGAGAGTGLLDGIGAALAALIPAVVGILSIIWVVTASEQISNRLFGAN